MILLDVSPFALVRLDFCFEVPATKWQLVTPCHAMASFRFTLMGWFIEMALGLESTFWPLHTHDMHTQDAENETYLYQ